MHSGRNQGFVKSCVINADIRFVSKSWCAFKWRQTCYSIGVQIQAAIPSSIPQTKAPLQAQPSRDSFQSKFAAVSAEAEAADVSATPATEGAAKTRSGSSTATRNEKKQSSPITADVQFSVAVILPVLPPDVGGAVSTADLQEKAPQPTQANSEDRTVIAVVSQYVPADERALDPTLPGVASGDLALPAENLKAPIPLTPQPANTDEKASDTVASHDVTQSLPSVPSDLRPAPDGGKQAANETSAPPAQLSSDRPTGDGSEDTWPRAPIKNVNTDRTQPAAAMPQPPMVAQPGIELIAAPQVPSLAQANADAASRVGKNDKTPVVRLQNTHDDVKDTESVNDRDSGKGTDSNGVSPTAGLPIPSVLPGFSVVGHSAKVGNSVEGHTTVESKDSGVKKPVKANGTEKEKAKDVVSGSDDQASEADNTGHSAQDVATDTNQLIASNTNGADATTVHAGSHTAAMSAVLQENTPNQRVHENSRVTDGGSAARANGSLPSLRSEVPLAAGINTARLVQTMNQSEMRIGLHSPEFGLVSVRTSVTSQQMVAQITVEHGELGRALSAHLPAAEAKLGHQSGLPASIEIRDQGMSFSNQSGDRSRNQQEQFPGIAMPNLSTLDEGRTQFPVATLAVSDSSRLDIRA